MRVLAIDQGTSSTKALVEDESGALLSCVEVPVHPVRSLGDAVEQSPDELWDSVLAAGRGAVSAAGVAIDAVGLANQGETVLAWDRATGRALTTALSWQDRRAAGLTARLAHRSSELEAISGLPLDPYFAAPKMAYLREHVTSEGVVTTTDAWLVHRLTGEFVTDAATASRTLLLDLARSEWSATACAAFGISPDDLPAVTDCAGAVGELHAFGSPAALTGLAVDQQAALFGERCWSAGDAKCTYGTGAFLLVNAGTTPVRSRSGLAACIAWRLAGSSTYCLDGQVYAAGSALSWLVGAGLLSEPADLDAVAGSAGDTGGVVFVPALAGLAAPFWRPEARAAFLGLGLHTSRAELVRAVVEGLAASVARLVDVAARDLGEPFTRLRVDGGLTRSRTLMQIQADLLQLPVEVFASPHATAHGVAALARIGAGDEPGAAAIARARRPAAVFEPRISADEAQERLARWTAAVEASLAFETSGRRAAGTA